MKQKFKVPWKTFKGTKKLSNIKTFVINLKRRHDRLLKLQENIPISNYEVFEAIDGSLIDNPSSLKPGEYGAARSHYKLWEQCVIINQPILIIEDDAQFKYNFNDILESLEFSESSIIFLGGSPNGFSNINKKTINDVLCLKVAPRWLRLECYIIFPQLAKELLKSYKFNSPIDVFLNNFTKEIYLLKNEITYPGDSRKDSDTL